MRLHLYYEIFKNLSGLNKDDYIDICLSTVSTLFQRLLSFSTINFSSLFLELRCEGHDRSRPAKLRWVANRKRKGPGDVRLEWVSVVDGNWLWCPALVVSVACCWQLIDAQPWVEQFRFDLRSDGTPFSLGLDTVEVMATTYIWILFGGVIYVAFLGLNEETVYNYNAYHLSTQSGSNMIYFDCGQSHRFAFGVLLCSWLQIMFLTFMSWAGSSR